MLLGRLRRPGVPPRGLRLVFRFVRSPRLLLLELFSSFKFRVAALAGLLFGSSCACLVSSGTAASRMLTVVLALGGLSGCSPLGVPPPRFPPCCLLPLWVVSAATWELASHFFPLPFPLESLSLHGSWSGFCRGSTLRVVSSCSFLRVACLRSGGGGIGWLSLAGPYVLRDVYLGLFESLLFPSCATRGRFDVPGVLVSGSGLSASACSHACGRFRGIALGPGAGFPFVSLPGGRVV